MDEKSLIPMSELDNSRYELMASYKGKSGIYQIFGIRSESGPLPLAETGVYRIYPAQLPSGQLGLMKVNLVENPNSYESLRSEVRVLSSLAQIAEQLDDEEDNPGRKPFYGAFFPSIIETLEPEDNKIIVFMGYHESISAYRQMQPLSILTNGHRIDLKTAAWILGKGLKTLAYIHSLDFTIGQMDQSNIMLETAIHGLMFLNFANSNEAPTQAEKNAETMKFVTAIWNASGGTEEALPPHDVEIMSEGQHTKLGYFMMQIMNGDIVATEAHKQSYKLFDEIWPRKRKTDEFGSVLKRDFHEFTLYEISES